MVWSLLALLMGTVENVFAQIIFSTGLEDVQNWTQTRPPKNATGYGWPSSWSGYKNGNPVYPPPRKTDGTFLFDMFRVGATVFDSNVTPAFEIKDGIGRDGGRGLVYNVEVSGSYGVWTGGNPVGVWLGNTGCQDVYVRFYLRYPPEWKWTDDNNPISNRGAQQKILRLSRYNGTLNDGGNPQVYGPSSGGKNDPVWIPDWYQYISVTPSYSKFMNSERYSPDYTANDPATDFLSVKPNLYPSGSDLLWPTDSKWHSYEFRAKMNSAPGVADGISEIWLDGVLMWSKSNIAWVNAGGSILQGWNNVSILDNVTMPAYPLTSQVAYPLYLDNIVISTTYSGPPPKPVSVSAQAISTKAARVSWETGSNGATYPLNGYRIYYGTSPTSLTNAVTAGNVTSYDITGLQAGQKYYFAVVAYNHPSTDTGENESIMSNAVSVTVPSSELSNGTSDFTAPTVNISSPANGATLSGIATVTTQPSDNVGVSKVELYINGAIYGVTGAAPFNFTWNTSTFANGSYTITAKAYDVAGNVGKSSLVSVNVNNPVADTSSPTISILTPAYKATVSGIVSVTSKATDNVGVAKVAYYVNGILKSTLTTSPYSYSWDTKTVANGSCRLLAKAYDAAGNVGSYYIDVTVNNPAPDTVAPTVSVTTPASGATISGTTSITASASDNVGVKKVEFYVNGTLKSTNTASPYSYSLDTKTVANGNCALMAKAYDSAGNVGQSSSVTVNLFNDTVAPTVSMTAPTNGATISGTASIKASASDNVGVKKVEFYVNGTLKSTSTASPYSYSLDTKTVANGNCALMAKAYDSAGNVGQSSSVTVNLFNDTVAPTVSMTAPTNGATISDTASIKASASDNAGVNKVEFYVNGTLKSTSTASPYSYSLDTKTAANGNCALMAKAYDAAGNVGQSSSVTVTVFNDTVAPTVSITAPTNGATVSGIVSVTSKAIDNVGVANVKYYVNGVLKSTVTAAPYKYSWDTKTAANGSCRLLAKVYDAAGNMGNYYINVIIKN